MSSDKVTNHIYHATKEQAWPGFKADEAPFTGLFFINSKSHGHMKNLRLYILSLLVLIVILSIPLIFLSYN